MSEKTFLPETIFRNEKNELRSVTSIFDNKNDASRFIRNFWKEAMPSAYNMLKATTGNIDDEKELKFFHDTITLHGARTYMDEREGGKYQVGVTGNGSALPDEVVSWLRAKGYIT